MVQRLREAALHFASDGAAFLAQAIAFNVLFASIPLALLLVALLGYVYGTTAGNVEALALVQTYAPAMDELVANNIDNVVQYRGLSGSIGLVGLLWSGKNVFQALGYALDLSLGVKKHRHYLHDVALAVILVPLAGIVLLAASAIPIVISVVIRFTHLSSLRYAPEAGSYAAALATVFVLSLVLYTYLPNRRAPGIGFGVPGAIVFAAGWSLAQVAFAVYTTHTNFLRVYGAVSAAFALLLWIYLTAVIFLFGAHVCAAWERAVGNPVPHAEPA